MDEFRFSGKVLILGFGSIGQATLPLLLEQIVESPECVRVIAADDSCQDLATSHGVAFVKAHIDAGNYRELLTKHLSQGDFLLNLTVDICSLSLVELCHEIGCLYLDTCIEPWAGRYVDHKLSAAERSNYALREEALAMRSKLGSGPTAVITHGANPGLVSHFVKRALELLADEEDLRPDGAKAIEGNGNGARGATDWPALAQRLGIRSIHIAEYDTQSSSIPKQPGEFVNTWSVDGFISEGSQPAELGWGSHERELPNGGKHYDFGTECAIYLEQPGAATLVRTWTPLRGAFNGFLITHNESISIADFLTLRQSGSVVYRPTVHYAYRPCNEALLSLLELREKEWRPPVEKRLLMDDILPGGIDELGVLLLGCRRGPFWFGSQLTVDEARQISRNNNATSLQVVSGVLGGMTWAIENPWRGMVEPEEIDHRRVLEVAQPFLGPVVGVHADWSPISERSELFPHHIDREDPWQFNNFIVR